MNGNVIPKKDLTITVNPNGKVGVRFGGIWTRAEISRAFVSTLRELPGHIAREKTRLIKTVNKDVEKAKAVIEEAK